VRGAARPVFESVGFCGGLFFLGLGGVVSPILSRCGFQVFRVVLCCLQVFVEGAVVVARLLVHSFVFSFAVVFVPLGGLLGAPPALIVGFKVFSLVVVFRCVAWRLY